VKVSKRFVEAQSKVDLQKVYSLEEGVKLVKETATAKFDESIELAVKLSIDAKQADQAVRGAFSMPNGIGKAVRVVAFVDDANVEKAKEAGATEAGGQSLADKIKKEQWFDFDVAIAEPKMMRVVGQLGRVLGPKGLMPSPKAGTVVPDPIKAIAEFASGKQEYKNDAAGNLHVIIGKASFDEAKLAENLSAFCRHIQSVKPSGVKGGQYIEGVSIASTMGPGVKVEV
jgi:large subunit ribosomal protein L1